ncbi:MAG TPA: tyrosine-type recombinase/integrase [Bacteriovoracaceae bacterium]|nr:tyrosine-type recombinase/integrase [Bacteriovoracaceae bacterium]
MEVSKIKVYSISKYQKVDKNKLYYGFIYNFPSINTQEAYQRDLSKFLRFIQMAFKNLDEVYCEHAHVVAFKDFLIKKGESTRTINRMLSCLYSFYEYLIDLDLIDKNPVARVKRFQIEKIVKTNDLTDEQVENLLGVIPSTPAGLLHRAILTLYFTTGMRHREVSHLKFSNLSEELGMTVIKYKAKGGKEMVMPLNEKAFESLSDYLCWCNENDYPMTGEHFIFRATKNMMGRLHNKPLDPKSINYIIRKYAKRVGVDSKVTIHSARSTVIGKLLDQGHAIERVADFVGHKDISMTKAYSKRKQKLKDSLSFSL